MRAQPSPVHSRSPVSGFGWGLASGQPTGHWMSVGSCCCWHSQRCGQPALPHCARQCLRGQQLPAHTHLILAAEQLRPLMPPSAAVWAACGSAAGWGPNPAATQQPASIQHVCRTLGAHIIPTPVCQHSSQACAAVRRVRRCHQAWRQAAAQVRSLPGSQILF